MPLEKLLTFTNDVGDLANKPNATMTAEQLKAQFDAAPNEVRVYLNKLIDGLSSIVDGDSGADNVGATAIAGLTGVTVQAVLESLKASDDTNRAYLLEQINGVVLGQIPDEAITQSKISPSNTSVVPFTSDTGTANAKLVTLSPMPTVYVEGMAFAFKNLVANTGAVTVNVNGLGVVPVVKSNGNALTSGNLKAGSIYTVRKGTTSFILQGEGGEYGTAVASEVLAGRTIGTETGLLSGNIPNYSRLALGNTYTNAVSAKGDGGGALVIEPSRGYYETGLNVNGYGSIFVGDPDFIPSNIKQGVNIFGIDGSLVAGKKYATGTGTFNGSNQLVVTGLDFAPRMVIVNAPSVSAYGYMFKDISTTIMLMNNNGAIGQLSGQVFGATNFTVQGTSTLFGNAAATWWAYE